MIGKSQRLNQTELFFHRIKLRISRKTPNNREVYQQISIFINKTSGFYRKPLVGVDIRINLSCYIFETFKKPNYEQSRID
jgi:hypothetical protein